MDIRKAMDNIHQINALVSCKGLIVNANCLTEEINEERKEEQKHCWQYGKNCWVMGGYSHTVLPRNPQ